MTIWAKNKEENIRGFASEATRPRCVWCEHIEELKRNPKMGLGILEPLNRIIQNMFKIAWQTG